MRKNIFRKVRVRFHESIKKKARVKINRACCHARRAA